MGKEEMRKVLILTNLVGKDLAGFQIVEMTGVYPQDEEGRDCHDDPLGFFRDPEIAKAFAEQKTWCGTGRALILTDGKVGFLIKDAAAVKLFDDEEETLHLREAALAKLTPAQRKVLGFKSS